MRTDATGRFQLAKSRCGVLSNRTSSGSTRIAVRLQSRTSRDEIVGWNEENAPRIRITAPPVDGAANHALVRLLSQVLVLKKNAIRLVSGATSRNKIVEVDELSESALRSRLTRR